MGRMRMAVSMPMIVWVIMGMRVIATTLVRVRRSVPLLAIVCHKRASPFR
jgi:hypothetical protein